MKIHHCLPVVAVALLATGLHAETGKPSASTPKFAYGLLLQHGDKIVFSPCRDSSYSLVEDVSPDRVVTQALNSIGMAAGKRLYVELMAVLEGGVLKATALNLAQTEGRCQLPGMADEAWRASGNEPGWVLAAGGERVVLKRHGKPDLAVPYVAPQTDGKYAVFASEKLSFKLENSFCRDSMADAVFGWKATVTFDGQTLQGCAWQR